MLLCFPSKKEGHIALLLFPFIFLAEDAHIEKINADIKSDKN